MIRLAARVKRYLMRPEAGAGLMFTALAFGVIKMWLTWFVAARSEPAMEILATPGPDRVLVAWTVVSFIVSAGLAFLLLRRRLSPRTLKRVLLITAAHAAGAFRFYDWGMMLLAVLPLFALAPALLLPAGREE